MRPSLIPTALTLALWAGLGRAADLPPTLAGRLDEMAAMCEEVGGQADATRVVTGGRLDNGTPFWLVDEGNFQCTGASALFSGSGGAQVEVYLRLPDGVQPVFSHGAFDAKVERNTIWLTVGGPLCGQPGEPSHAESKLCERPLEWDAKAGKMAFAPLSRIRPLPPSR
ncbi:MAG: hypothetical protein ACM3Q1_02210 [Bacteroidales bacterium]